MCNMGITEYDGDIRYKVTSWTTLATLQEGDTLVRDGETFTVDEVDLKGKQGVLVDTGEVYPYSDFHEEVGVLLEEDELLKRLTGGLSECDGMVDAYVYLVSYTLGLGITYEEPDSVIQIALNGKSWINQKLQVYYHRDHYLVWHVLENDTTWPPSDGNCELFQSKEGVRGYVMEQVKRTSKQLKKGGVDLDILGVEVDMDELDIVDGEFEASAVTYSL